LLRTPLEAALSIMRFVALTCSAADSSPVAMAARAFLASVFSCERVPLLRSRARSFCRLRFFWDLMFAIAPESTSESVR